MEHMIKKFENKLSRYKPENRDKILKASYWAKDMHKTQKRASGEPYFIHPLQVAELLVDMQMDYETIIAALLHDVLEDTNVSAEEMTKIFGHQIVSLVDGVTKISIVKAKSKSVQEAETIRKMLFAMTKDIRVIIIKLADKLHNMNTLEHLSEEKKRAIAAECLDIYAPLAGRLGISWLKAELEDLSLKHLHPDTYKYIQDFIYEKENERSSYLKRIKKAIHIASRAEKIKIEVTIRAKHCYSIYRKMKKSGKDLNEIYDFLGVRILCNTTNECYTLLGIIHNLWPPIEGRIKDYIAMPKANQYRSLHTTVMCYEGKLLEIQIRTFTMNRTAEFGVAAHWAYKSGASAGRVNPKDLLIINKLKSWNGLKITTGEFMEEIKGELLKDSIYIFTPTGQIVELPRDSTPIDFAYHIHTEIGNHCIAAKADGSIIPLNSILKNTQVIEILTSNKATPHVNWLRFVKTAKARSRIRHWLNKHDETLFLDKNIIAKKKTKSQEKPASREDKTGEIVKHVIDKSKVVYKIGNEKNMMISLAGCCNPSLGDNIIGYVSRGRGIIVHKRNCPNLAHIKDFANRNIEVEWEAVTPRITRRFRVTARTTSDLFSEIEGAVRKYKGHLIEGRLEENERGNLTGHFIMELDENESFGQVIKRIRTIPSIINIQPFD